MSSSPPASASSPTPSSAPIDHPHSTPTSPPSPPSTATTTTTSSTHTSTNSARTGPTLTLTIFTIFTLSTLLYARRSAAIARSLRRERDALREELQSVGLAQRTAAARATQLKGGFVARAPAESSSVEGRSSMVARMMKGSSIIEQAPPPFLGSSETETKARIPSSSSASASSAHLNLSPPPPFIRTKARVLRHTIGHNLIRPPPEMLAPRRSKGNVFGDARKQKGEGEEEGLLALDEKFKELCIVANAAQWDSPYTPSPPKPPQSQSSQSPSTAAAITVNTGSSGRLVSITHRHTQAFKQQGSQLRENRQKQAPVKIAQYPTTSGVRARSIPSVSPIPTPGAASVKLVNATASASSSSSSLRDEEEGELLAADLFGPLPSPGNMAAAGGKQTASSSSTTSTKSESDRKRLGELSEEAEQVMLSDAIFYVPPATSGFAEGEELQEREQTTFAAKTTFATRGLEAKPVRGANQHKGRVLPAAHTLSEAQEDGLAAAILDSASVESGFAEGEELRERAIHFATVPSASDWTTLVEEAAITRAYFGPAIDATLYPELVQEDAPPSREIATSSTLDPEDDMSLGAAELALLMHARGEVPLGSETPAAAASRKSQKKEQRPVQASKKTEGQDGGDQGGSSGGGGGGFGGFGGANGGGGAGGSSKSPPESGSAKKFWRDDVFNRGDAASNSKLRSSTGSSSSFASSPKGNFNHKASETEASADWHAFFPFQSLHREQLSMLDSFVQDQQARLRGAAGTSTVDVKFGLHAAKLAAQSTRKHQEAFWMFPHTAAFGGQAKQQDLEKRSEKQEGGGPVHGAQQWQYDHVFHAWRPFRRFGDRSAWWR